ncbi:unnamed protein product, partial [Ectocarpus sp. 8 AP-2014]
MPRIKRHVLSSTLARHVSSSRWQEAFLLLETMQERGVTPDLYTLNSVLKASGSAGQVERERGMH